MEITIIRRGKSQWNGKRPNLDYQQNYSANDTIERPILNLRIQDSKKQNAHKNITPKNTMFKIGSVFNRKKQIKEYFLEYQNMNSIRQIYRGRVNIGQNENKRISNKSMNYQSEQRKKSENKKSYVLEIEGHNSQLTKNNKSFSFSTTAKLDKKMLELKKLIYENTHKKK